ncbi:uncharacterized protein LOC123307181 [Coccinella septempunctata]|nr:uncharacterized protein LOC123307181 [Coccinella septempunctata]
MKFLILPVFVTFLSLVSASSLDPEVVKKIHEECFKISHLPKEGLDKIRTGNVDLSDEAVKNHIFCYTKKVGFVNDDGILNGDLIKEKLALQVKDQGKVERYAKVCNKPKTPNEEVNLFAAKVVDCYYKHSPGLSIFHVNQETIKKMESGVFDDTNPDIRKHIFCYTQKVGFINDKAELQKDVIRRKMSQQVKNLDLVDKVIQMCTFPLEGDKNLWACKTLACYYKSAPVFIMMKFLVVAACAIIAVQALTDEQKEKLKNYSTACSESTGVDKEAITNARKGLFTDNEKYKDYLFCMSKKIGYQNEAGEIQKDVLREKALTALKDEKLVDNLIEKCAVAKDTPQNTAFETIKCYYENNPKHIPLA